MLRCKYNLAWQGRCKKEALEGSEYCEDHKGILCCVCKEQANRECDYAGQFVCGVPLCENCEDWHDGTPSVWGFLGHKHSRKGECH